MNGEGRNAIQYLRVAKTKMQQSTFDIPENEVAQIRAEIRAQIDEMKRINEQMRENQSDTERLKRQTRANLAELSKMVAL